MVNITHDPTSPEYLEMFAQYQAMRAALLPVVSVFLGLPKEEQQEWIEGGDGAAPDPFMEMYIQDSKDVARRAPS